MIDNSNQIAPLRVKENAALYNLTKFARQMIEMQRAMKSPLESIEIEGRIGQFVPKDARDLMTLQQISFMRDCTSLQGMHLINHIIPNQYKFESNVDEKKFDNALHYLEQIAKTNKEKAQSDRVPNQNYIEQQSNFFKNLGAIPDIGLIQNTQNDLIMDMVLGQNIRISYYVNKGKFEVLNKESNQEWQNDIIHNALQYRISAKKETTLENQNISELLKKNQVQTFRFKQRKSFMFQDFMEISCTRVLQVDKKNNLAGFLELSEGLEDRVNNLQELSETSLRFFGKFFLLSDPNFFSKKREIEVEIKNLKNMFNDNDKIVEMKFRAFMKNLQCLERLGLELLPMEYNTRLKDKFHEQQRVAHQNSGNTEPFDFSKEVTYEMGEPVVGEYMKKEMTTFMRENLVPDALELNKH